MSQNIPINADPVHQISPSDVTADELIKEEEPPKYSELVQNEIKETPAIISIENNFEPDVPLPVLPESFTKSKK